MGTFVETAIANYLLSLLFSISFIFRKYMYTVYAAVTKGKRKPRRFSLIHLQFAHRANGSLLFVHLLTKKQNRSSLFANRLDGLKRLAHL
jgi:hypothetical protein